MQEKTENTENPEDGESNVYNMFPLRSKIYDLIGITLTVNGEPLRMEVDTGATLSVISEVTYRQMWGNKRPPLGQSKARLRTYTGE